MSSICYNGRLLPADQPVFQADNRSYRYGDGLFETMRVFDGRILLANLHFDRFFKGLEILGIIPPKLLDRETLAGQVIGLAKKNKAESSGRVRLSGFRGNGGILEGRDDLHWLVECWPLEQSVDEFNQNGLVLGIYPFARKSCDPFANLKSASFQPYSLAARYAKKQQWNDALVLNSAGKIADSTIANIFIVNNGIFSTPALHQGCVDGVMRRFLVRWLKDNGYEVNETVIDEDALADADEVILTNAIRGIRWVGSYGDEGYGQIISSEIHREVRKAIQSS